MTIKIENKNRIRPEKCKHRYQSGYNTLCHLLDDELDIYDKQCRYYNCKLIKNNKKEDNHETKTN